MGKEQSSVFGDLFAAIKFCMESKKGKYSLQTYLDIVSEYADRQIVLNEEKGLTYMGGSCHIKGKENDPKKIKFKVELFFEDEQKQSIKKEAEKELSLDKFVSETIAQIGTDGLDFNISRPGGEK